MNRLRTTIKLFLTITVLACHALIPSGCDFKKSELERQVDAFLKMNDYERATELVENFLQQHPAKPIGRAMMVRVLAADGQTDRAFREYYRFYKQSKTIAPHLLIEISSGALNHRDSSVRNSAEKTMASLDDERDVTDLIDVANGGDRSGTAGGSRAVPSFIKALKDSDVSVRQTAVEMLGGFGDTRAVPALIETLNDSDVVVRQTAVEMLGGFGDTRAVPALIETLNDSDVVVRQTAVEVLGGFGDTRAVPALIDALNDCKDPEGLNRKVFAEFDNDFSDLLREFLGAAGYSINDLEYNVRSSAARALGKLRDNRAVPALIHSLNDSNAIERVITAKALSDLGDERGVFALTGALNDNDDFVRGLAAEALVGLVDIGSVPALIAALKNNTGLVRDYLAKALVELGDRSVVPVLIEILGGDESIDLKFSAAEALVKLTR